MKKFILFLLLCMFIGTGCNSSKLLSNTTQYEIVNDKTVIFRNVVKIEVQTCNSCENQITYIYDLNNSKLVKVARGSFSIEIPNGNYLIQSDKRITNVDYKVLVEYERIPSY